MKKGKLIVIDGLDGSGKETQSKKLIDFLKSNEKLVKMLDFPRYDDNFFGKFVKGCLNGQYGDFLELDPHIASVVYASDRFESSEEIKKLLKKEYFVVLDRYVSANQIHQGGKIKDPRKRKEFLDWLDKMEYDIFKIPKPDIVIFLDMPIKLSQKLLKDSNKKMDIVEQNLIYQENSRNCALDLVKENINWEKIDCTRNGNLKSIKEINIELIEILKKVNII